MYSSGASLPPSKSYVTSRFAKLVWLGMYRAIALDRTSRFCKEGIVCKLGPRELWKESAQNARIS